MERFLRTDFLLGDWRRCWEYWWLKTKIIEGVRLSRSTKHRFLGGGIGEDVGSVGGLKQK